MSMLRNLFNPNERELRKITPLVEAVSRLESGMKRLSDSGLQAKTREFKERISRGESVDSLLPEAFAVCLLYTSRCV